MPETTKRKSRRASETDYLMRRTLVLENALGFAIAAIQRLFERKFDDAYATSKDAPPDGSPNSKP